MGTSKQAITAVQIDRYMQGLEFPASIQKIVSCAEENTAPDFILEYLEQLPNRDYESVDELDDVIDEHGNYSGGME